MTNIGFIWEWEKIFARYIATHEKYTLTRIWAARWLFQRPIRHCSPHLFFLSLTDGFQGLSLAQLVSFPRLFSRLSIYTSCLSFANAHVGWCWTLHLWAYVARARLAHELNWRCAHALLRGAARAFCSPKSGNDGWMMIVNWDAITETIETITERCVGQGQRCLSIVCSIPEVDDSGRWSYSDDLWAETGSKIGGWRYRYSITYWW